MKNNNIYRQETEHKLFSVFRKELLIKAVVGLNLTVIVILTANLIAALLVLAGLISIEARTILFFTALLIMLTSFFYFVIIPLIKSMGILAKPNFFLIADKVGKAFPQVKDSLLNSLQLINEKRSGYSESLINAAFRDVYEKTKHVDFSSTVSFIAVKKYFQSSMLIIVFTVLLFVFIPGLRGSSYKLLNYDKAFIDPLNFIFDVQPGSVQLTKGQDLTIYISALGETPGEISLFTQTIEQTGYDEHELYPDSTGIFRYRINSVSVSFKYFAAEQNIVSDTFSIEVINRPIISSLELEIFPPAYSKLPREVQKDNGNITSLAGSRIKINIKSTKPVKSAELNFSDSTKTYLNPYNYFAEGNFVVTGNTNYKISILDQDSISNTNPIIYSIKTLIDEYPIIQMIEPNTDVKISDTHNLQLVSKITDDYGFEKLVLNYRLNASKYGVPWSEFEQQEIVIAKNKKEQEIYFVWDLSPLVLAVEDVVSYYLEIFDNDNVNGPKSTKTSLFTIRVPSLDELFAEAENAQTEAEKDLIETLKETEKLNEELQRISNELKQDKQEISWVEKEKIESAIKKFQELENKVELAQQKLNEMQKQLQENNLLSEETMKKYMELQDLMDELNSEELKNAFDRLREMLETLNRENTQQAFENLQFNEEAFQKSLERTVNLLKRIQIEQKVDELIKRSEEALNQIDDLQNEMQQKDLSLEDNKEELKQKQEKVSERLEKIEEEMEKLKEKMSEFDDMPLDQMQKMLDQLKEQNNTELSNQASQQITQQQKQQAVQNQQQLSENMQSLQQQLMQMQSSMQMQSQMQVLYDMMKSVNDLLTLSKEQELLKNNTQNTPATSLDYLDNAKTQNDIQRNLDKAIQQMVDLSQRTFAITPEMGRALGNAKSEMGESISSIQNRNSSRTIQSQISAMKYLNEAASLMKGSMEQMMGGGQGGGMMSLMQQLQQMSQQQMNLNQLTQQLNQGQLTQQQLSQLQRLTQEQELIRKSLEQLNKEAQEKGQSKKLSTSLEKILEEMKEVVTNMNTEKVNDELIQAQERILSKLLDAQRSINERDFEKERESISGRTFNRESPPEIIFGTEEGKDKLRDELLKAVREGYSKDFEELIRKYYEQLSTQKSEKN